MTRAILGLASGLTAMACAAAKPEGAVIDAELLRASPGFVLEPGANNDVVARKNNGGTGTKFQCSCSGQGMCRAVFVNCPGGQCISCQVDTGESCSKSCVWTAERATVLSQ